MQANLQATTFNKHNYMKNERVNHLKNPYVNNISRDLSYKSHSITDVARNPLHIAAGDDYLYYKRIELLKRQLNQRRITLHEYEQAVRKIEIAMKKTPMNVKQTDYVSLPQRARSVSQVSDGDVMKIINGEVVDDEPNDDEPNDNEPVDELQK